MPRQAGLRGPGNSQRSAQAARYDHLAQFMYKLTTVHGKHQFSVQGLRGLLTRGHILTKEGHVNHERLDNLARSLGVHNPKTGGLPEVFEEYDDYYDDDSDVWGDILEGES